MAVTRSVVRLRTAVVPDSCLVLPDDDGNVYYGSAVLIDEARSHLIVGHQSKHHDFGSGAVYCGAVYVTDWTTGALVQEILPPNAADQVDGAAFGWGVALSGDWLAITALGASGVVGSVHFYEWTGATYTFRQRLNGSGALAANNFGKAVGLSGALCVVGDNAADLNGTNSGTIHVFRLSGTWAEDVAAKTNAPTTQNNQYFGHAVAVDAPHIAVSANQFYGDYDDQGRAYMFEDGGTGNPLVLRATLTPPVTGDTAADIFGDSLDLVGDRCAVGWANYTKAGGPVYCGRIEVYKRNGATWPHHQSLDLPTASQQIHAELGFGNWTSGSVRMAGDYLLGGARGWEGSPDPGGWPGAAFLWECDAATDLYAPVDIADGYAPDDNPYAIYPACQGEFGAAVAITASGKLAIAAHTEYGDWETNYALPEGSPPDYSYCGTVRQYQVTWTAPTFAGWTDPDGGRRQNAEGEYCLEITDAKDNRLLESGHINRDYTVVSRCRFRLLCRRGQWWADPEIGSRLHEIKTLKDAKAKVDAYCAEALEPLVLEGAISGVQAVAVETDPDTGMLLAHIAVTLPDGQSLTLEAIPVGQT